MRKHLIWIIAVVAALSVAAVAYAADTTTGTQTMKVSPSKLSKTSFKPVKLTTETTFLYNTDPGTPTAPTLTPAAARDVKLKFDDDVKFTTKGLATCKQSDIEGTLPSQAIAACPKAQIGSGSATVCIVATPGSACFPFQAVITAFNGEPKGKTPVILLHTRVDALSSTVILVGTLKGGGTGDFGTTLDVKVPSTVPTSATDFVVSINKKFTSKGKKYSYVSARCADSNKQLNLATTITYASPEDKDTPTSFQKCTT